jgi:hypothetical protein
MRARFLLSAPLFLVLIASLAHAQSPDQSAPETQQQPETQKPSASSAVPVSQAQSAHTSAPPKHHVFTNDDFDSLPHEANVNGGRDLLEQVNSCDRNCFDQIARTLGGSYSLSVHWKQSLLNAVDKSKENLPWQQLLGEAIAIQAQSCELQMKKHQDMNRFADPRTVTHKELMVDREYEPKFREMTRRLNEVAVRANTNIRAVTDPYLAEFMRLELNRIVNAQCHIYVSQPQPRRDPEDADAPDPDDPSPSDDEQ